MLNLKKLSDRLDSALSNETPESLNDWLDKKRSMDVKEFLKSEGGIRYSEKYNAITLVSDDTILIDLKLSGADLGSQLGKLIEEAVNEKLKSGWVRVEDFLPDNDNEVLIAVKGSNYPIQGYYYGGKWYGSQELRDSIPEGSSIDFDLPHNKDWFKITHWQPLPKLPGE